MVRWDKQRRSTNVEDRRGRRPRMGTPMKMGGGMGLLIILAVVLLGGDPTSLLQSSGPGSMETSQPTTTPVNDAASDEMRAILGSTEDVWSALFTQAGASYRQPKLVMFEEGEVIANQGEVRTFAAIVENTPNCFWKCRRVWEERERLRPWESAPPPRQLSRGDCP